MRVDELLSDARESMSVKKVFGEPVEENGVTVIPVANVRGGGGGGGDTEGNGGAGFGLTARPAGAYVIKDGEATWKPAVNPNAVMVGWQLVTAFALFVLWRIRRNG
jgi:uncharacterized spore protein YtfJ